MIALSPEQRRAQGTMVHDRTALQRIRECWRCDCDGVSHAVGGFQPTGTQAAILANKSHIKAVTGLEPITCPWRAMYDPLVGEAVKVAGLADSGLVDSYLGDDPPAIVIDAAHAYIRAKNATTSHDLEQERKQREAELKSKRRG